jgi:hypothetical protein
MFGGRTRLAIDAVARATQSATQLMLAVKKKNLTGPRAGKSVL